MVDYVNICIECSKVWNGFRADSMDLCWKCYSKVQIQSSHIMGPLVLYLAGPYRGEIDINIQNARKNAKLLWEAGYFVITPHLNTQHFEKDCDAPEEIYLEGYIEIMKRCDGVALITEDYSHSAGTAEEVKIANENSIPVHSVLWWLKKMEHYHLDQYDV